MSCGFDGEYCHEEDLLEEIEDLIERQGELLAEIEMLRSHLLFRDGRCRVHLEYCGLAPGNHR